MISTKLSGNWGGLGSGSGSLMRRLDMERLGDFAIQTVKRRAMTGLGSDGTPMPPLKSSKRFVARDPKNPFRFLGYAAWKVKVGLHGVRDLVGDGSQGGHMWDNLTVRSVTEQLVRMAFTERHQREKALANEQRATFLSFSPADQAKIVGEASRLFGVNVRSLGVTQAIAILRKKKMAA
jgi:hypothetical protein